MTFHHVLRWHSHPDARLRNSNDTVGAHSERVFRLAIDLEFAFGGHVSQSLGFACLYHDAPEAIMGDWPATLTRNYRIARWAKAILEWQIKREMGISWRLTRQEKQILSLCDTLDAVLWAAKHGVIFDGDIAMCKAKAAKLGPKSVEWLEGKLALTTAPQGIS